MAWSTPKKITQEFENFRNLRKTDDYSATLQALNEAKASYPDGKPIVEFFAEAVDYLIKFGSIDEAEILAVDGTSLWPNSTLLIIRLGRVYALQRKESAISVLRELLRVSPLPEGLSLEAALIEAYRVDRVAAIQLVSDLSALYPKSLSLAKINATYCNWKRDYRGAVDHLKHALFTTKDPKKRDLLIAKIEAISSKAGLPFDFELHTAGLRSDDSFTVAALTMVYNEKFNLPIWLGHYGRQVGIHNCIILDHGSDDGSTDDLGGANRVRLPRGRLFDERARMRLINNFANDLLQYYDAVVYSDCDEMLVADPGLYTNLVDYAHKLKRPVAYAIGLNIRHDPTSEPPLTNEQPILRQRTRVQFVTPMCKPLLLRKPISWGGGFHACEHPPEFDDLYLFHLRMADMDQALKRMAITRNIQFARDGAGAHQRRPDDDVITGTYMNVQNMGVIEKWDFTKHLAKHMDGMKQSTTGRYKSETPARSGMIRVPERFREVF